jgi:hypothetical protein
MALQMMDISARNEVLAMFPDLNNGLGKDAVARIYGETARAFAPKGDVKSILEAAREGRVQDRAVVRNYDGWNAIEWPQHAQH